jgi:hypothetical protein
MRPGRFQRPARLPGHLRAQRARLTDRHHQPAVRHVPDARVATAVVDWLTHRPHHRDRLRSPGASATALRGAERATSAASPAVCATASLAARRRLCGVRIAGYLQASLRPEQAPPCYARRQLRFAEGVAQGLGVVEFAVGERRRGRRVPLSSKGVAPARGSAGGELVLVELQEVVGGRQQSPFGPDSRPAAA